MVKIKRSILVNFILTLSWGRSLRDDYSKIKIDVLKPLQCKTKWICTMNTVALSNGLHGSVQMDWVALPPWNFQHHTLLRKKVIAKSITLVQFIDNPILRTYPLDNIDHLDCSSLYPHNLDCNHIRNHYLLHIHLKYYQMN